MLKEYLDKNKISIYQLSKSAQIPYSTLNDLVNKKMDGKNCTTGTIKKLAAALGMSRNQVFELCSYSRIYEKDGARVKSYVRGNMLCLEYKYGDFSETKPLFSIQNIDSLYLESICRHELDKFLKQIEREKVACTTI